jgi:hypothetical protein
MSPRPDPLRTEVQHAFAESMRVIWLVLIPFVSPFTLVFHVGYAHAEHVFKAGVGFLLSLCMKGLPLESVTDEVSVTLYSSNLAC